MQKRIVTLQREGISGGRWLTRPFRDARRFPLYTIAARTQMHTPGLLDCRKPLSPYDNKHWKGSHVWTDRTIQTVRRCTPRRAL